MDKKDRYLQFLKLLQVVFYLLFLVLWFKDSFPFLKNLPLSPFHALILLAGIILFRVFLKFKSRKLQTRPLFTRTSAALALIILLAMAVHIPFLMHNFGLMDSDEAIPALMGKHIAEGKRPALYYYGAFFQGSLPQHYYALMISLFGYSVFLVKFAAFLAFLAFVCVHFILLRELFSFEFACATGLFFCLPFPSLIAASVDIGSGFPLVFLFGSLIFLLTYRIVDQKKEDVVALLGFIMGLAFWTHQISVIFILTSAFFLVSRFKFVPLKYAKLAVYFLVGIFPLLMNEIYRKFVLVKFLLPSGEGSLGWDKVERAKRLTLSLISGTSSELHLLFLGLFLLGLGILVFRAFRNKRWLPFLLFPVYFTIFMAIYTLSGFSEEDIIRYLYILYLVLPVGLGSVFYFLKTKVKYPAMIAFFLLLFFLGSGKSGFDNYQAIKTKHRELSGVIQAMEETGEKYWMGEYWISYLLTSLAGERVVVASYTVRRYYPYHLMYFSETAGSNWVFYLDYADHETVVSNLSGTLNRLQVKHERRDINRFALIYRTQGVIFPKALDFSPPEGIPEVYAERVVSSDGEIQVQFTQRTTAAAPSGSFRLRIEIPGYSSKSIPLPKRENFLFRIPSPRKDGLKVLYLLEYAGFQVPETRRELEYSYSHQDPQPSKPGYDFLSGIGPRRDVLERRVFVCGQEARIRVDSPGGTPGRVSLHLFSPFYFNHPFWYEDYGQEVDIFVNDRLLSREKITDGENIISLEGRTGLFRPGENIISLKFKYAFTIAHSDLWKTAALIEKITIEREKD